MKIFEEEGNCGKGERREGLVKYGVSCWKVDSLPSPQLICSICAPRISEYILGDLGAVSRVGRKGVTKVFKHERKIIKHTKHFWCSMSGQRSLCRL